MNNFKGFTLIELMVVMAVMAIAYSLIGPNLFNTYQKMQISAEHREFKEVLKSISYKSFINGREVSLLLEGRNIQYGYIDDEKRHRVNFEYVNFPKQEIVFTSSGFPNIAYYSMLINDKKAEFLIENGDL